MCSLPTPEQAEAARRALDEFPGTGVANDPRSGVRDFLAIYVCPERPGTIEVIRYMIGVLPYPEYPIFRDPRRAGFYTLKRARGWVSQEFPYCRVRVAPRRGVDDPRLIESWACPGDAGGEP